MKDKSSDVYRFGFLLRITFLFLGLVIMTINSLAQEDSFLESLKEQALNAQERMDRMSLDSIADLMIRASAGMGDDAYLNSAKYFKSDAITRKDPNLGIQYGEEALEYFKAKNDFYNLSRVNNVLGHSYSNIGEHLKAIEYYKASTENSKLLDNGNSREEIKYQSRVYYNSGFTLVRRGDLDAAMEYLLEHILLLKSKTTLWW